MAIKLNGTNTEASPGFTGDDTDTGLQCGTNELSLVTGGSKRATVDSSGRLLVGTDSARTAYTGILTPRLQLEGTSSETSHLMVTRNENTATPSGLVLAKSRGTSTGSNVIVQNNDAVGVVGFEGSDGVDTVRLAEIAGYVDGTPGADDMPGRLVFSTTADSASSPTERMRITNAGVIQAGGSSASTAERFLSFCVSGTTNGYGTIPTTNASYTAFVCRNSSGVSVGTITCTTTSTAYNTTSDYRLKENVVPVADGITRLQQLKPSRFNFIANPDRTVDGFLAHEVQDIIPEAITGEKDAVDDEGNPVYQGIDQSKLVPLLTAALQEAIAKIEALETRLTALEGGAA